MIRPSSQSLRFTASCACALASATLPVARGLPLFLSGCDDENGGLFWGDAQLTAKVVGPPKNGLAAIASTDALPSTATNQSDSSEETASTLEEGTDRLLKKVVKMHVSSVTYNDRKSPWIAKSRRSTGSGFVVDKARKRIVTNAHVVDGSVEVMVSKPNDAQKYPAKVLRVSEDCDLALVEVEDASFFDDVEEAELAPYPKRRAGITVVGFPMGGDNTAFTIGVANRVECRQFGGPKSPVIQIDAASNPGNSGGPAFDDEGRVAGVAFEGIRPFAAQNINYIIPSAVIRRFVAAADLPPSESAVDVLTCGASFQKMENKTSRDLFGLSTLAPSALPKGVTPTGVLVRDIDETSDRFIHEALAAPDKFLNSPSGNVRHNYLAAIVKTLKGVDPERVGLRRSDVVLAVEGRDIANDGQFNLEGKQGRLPLKLLLSLRQPGDVAQATVLRRGQVMEVYIPLMPIERKIPRAPQGVEKKQHYLVYGGFLFGSMERQNVTSRVHSAKTLRSATQDELGDENVVLLRILPDISTVGYESSFKQSVMPLKTVNGVPPRSLKHLAALLEDNAKNLPDAPSIPTGSKTSKKYVEFEMETGVKLVVDTVEAKAATERVMEVARIPAPMKFRD